MHARVPKITVGKMYKRSKGQANSPYWLCPIPFDSSCRSFGSLRSGFFIIGICMIIFVKIYLTPDLNWENFVPKTNKFTIPLVRRVFEKSNIFSLRCIILRFEDGIYRLYDVL